MVLNIRLVEDYMAKRIKVLLSEKIIKIFKKINCCQKNIKKGEKFSLDNLTTKGQEMEFLNELNRILSQKSTKNLNKDDLIK